ncbi:hypothetical protein HELRODRAFT_174976 [Helobdella robusta]|uniref:Anaphase-promoting complex subunit 4 WD40 domain-containing protein n=1 Tax=Helobdella robusta TaxID=6412 RepID=T1F8N9_HELRO|nr:hypothetical protein HELRODRAFT_174976 [Helobdella robusta]ESO01417.1 hypothetical protein HELRODRAFT_174976 [Helobdella robusta]
MVLSNVFDQATVFKPHTDFARHLEKIDEKRHCQGYAKKYCSGGDDGSIVIIDTEKRKIVQKLNGHTRPIACLHAKAVLISIPIFSNYFFSGGEKLLAWHIDKGMIDSCKPVENEDISFMLSFRNQFILIAVDNYVVVIEVLKNDKKAKKIKDGDDNEEGDNDDDDDNDVTPSFNLQNQLKLASHRETITALNKIDDDCFLTGSLDGSIYQWSVNNNWSPVHRYNYVDGYLGDMRIYPYSVQSIITVGKFIIAGHGNSIHIYDAVAKSLVVSKATAHDSKITYLSTLYQGVKHGDLMIESLGTCSLHSASVMKCIAVEPNKFLSCSNDFRVILWMDGFSENRMIYKRLRHMMPY